MRKRGGIEGGVLHKGFKGEEKRGGEKGGEEEKRGEGVQTLQIEVFASVFRYVCEQK